MTSLRVGRLFTGNSQPVYIDSSAVATTLTISSTNDTSLAISGGATVARTLFLNSTQNSSSAGSGSLVVLGGIGVSKNMSLDGQLSVNNTNVSINNTTGALISRGGIAVVSTADATNSLSGGALTLGGGLAVANRAFFGGVATFENTTSSLSSSSGALVVRGGLAVQSATDAASASNGGAMTVRGGAAFGKTVYIGGDAVVAGNLFIAGTSSSLVTGNQDIVSNIINLNTGNVTSNDAGFLIDRFQSDNDLGLGDIVTDTPHASGVLPDQSAATTLSLLVVPGAVSVAPGYIVKIGQQVRKITNVAGTLLTMSSPFTSKPQSGNAFTIYNSLRATHYFDPGEQAWIMGFTDSAPTDLIIRDTAFANLKCASVNAQGNLSAAGTMTISSTENSLNINQGGALTVRGGATIAKQLLVGESFTMLSDMRAKRNIRDIVVDMDVIDSIKCVEYEGPGDFTTFGFLAQDLKEKFPTLVHGTEDTHYSVDYIKMTVLLTSCVQQLRKEQQQLRKENERLYKLVTTLANSK